MDRRSIAALVTLGALLVLGACNRHNEQSVGGVTADEAAQLNNAAEMLDTSPDSLSAPEDAPLGNADADGSGSHGGPAAKPTS
ncbi:hypothetical protein [Flavisphingomonas formosensis]|uniref:hypothetical protein n=1 Tax=Flavisphingomonas formosensis TaxID=861534 RepID=UPI0012F79C64|nr:hypothetical protein [Sphingomonas formosensis]